jgi:hypothetical protein
MNYRYSLYLIVGIFLISSCSFNQLYLDQDIRKNYLIDVDDSVPISIKQDLMWLFDNSKIEDKEYKKRINVSNFSYEEYIVYGGSHLRSLEGEVVSIIELEISSLQETKNKSIRITGRYKSNELNPHAEKEIVKSLKENIYNQILDEILLEVKLFEM